jgi:hypothetical protein
MSTSSLALPVPSPTAAAPTAVEVVATMGDTVLGVRHLAPVPAKASGHARGWLLGAGAAMLLAGAAACAVSISRSSDDAARRDAWAAQGNPAWAFRADLGSRGLDLTALLGLGLGLPLVGLGLARRASTPARAVTIGRDANVDFALEGVALASHKLVGPAAGGGFTVNLTGLGGELLTAGHAPVAAASLVDLTAGVAVRTRVGKVGLTVRAVEAPATLPAVGAAITARDLAYVGGAATAALALLYLAGLGAPSALTAGNELGSEELIASAGTMVRADEPPPPEPEPTPTAEASGDSGGAAVMKLDEGATGAEHERPDPGRQQVAQRADAESRARSEAIETAATAGILGSQLLVNASMWNGADAISSGFDMIDQVGGWDGDGPGAPKGFGDGRTGTGPGACTAGSIWCTAKTRGYQTLAGPNNDRWAPGRPNGGGPDGGGREQRQPVVGPPEEVEGGVDKDIIRRYMRKASQRFEYCYEKALLSDPSLSGTVKTSFTINPAGAVIGATASGVSDEVSKCVAGVIRDIQFPHIGLVAAIKYPINYRRSGQ